MRRRASRDHGLLIAYLINLIFNGELFILAVIFFALTYFLNFPSFLWKVLILIWLVWTAIVTFALSSLISMGNSPKKEQKNVNPYSAKKPYITEQTSLPKQNTEE